MEEFCDVKKLLLILNPTSGMRKAAKNLTDIISVFNRTDYDTHVYVTACHGDAAKAVHQLGGAAAKRHTMSENSVTGISPML